MQYVGAVDQGTTSTRFILFDPHGAIVAMEQKEHRQICLKPGWVEHDGEEIWRNTREVIAAALRKIDLTPKDIAALGLANQRETTLIWDRATGAPLHNAIVWMDTRAKNLVEDFTRRNGKDFLRAKTGLPLATYFSGLKLRWLLDHVAEAKIKAANGEVLFGTMDVWLAWNLTGGVNGGLHVTDVTNASRTQLMNLATLDWDDEILSLFGIPRACLPRIASSSQFYESCQGELPGVPLSGVLGDQQAALLGQACLRPGDVKNTYGSGCFMLMNTGVEPFASKHGLLTTVAYRLGESKAVYALEGSVAIAGALAQWLRDNLNLIQSVDEIEALAKTTIDNGDVYFVPAFSGLYAPHWREDARGIIAGLTRFSNKGHLARAALEATAFQTQEILDAMERDCGVSIQELRADGGMAANDLLMQFQADILDVPVVRPKTLETTALGAAYAAGLAVNYWASFDDIAIHWGADRRWRPQMAEGERSRLLTAWRKAVARSMDWAHS